jgi:hypothetical protein
MKNQIRLISTLCFFMISVNAFCQSDKTEVDSINENYPISLVSFSDFKSLVSEIEDHRSQRLISLDTFLKMSNEPNTIILDTRSKYRYDRKHLKNAIHLEFTEFTQANLERLIPDKNTRILIYCNNNFDGDQIDFASKVAVITVNNKNEDGEILPNRKPIMLALNIPTYLNLYGYGYREVYELYELVNVGDKRIEFEGTQVLKTYRVEHLNLIKIESKE